LSNVKIAFGIGACDNELHGKAGRGLFHVVQLRCGGGITRVEEDRDCVGAWDRITQQPVLHV